MVQAEIDLNQAEIATYLMYVNQIKYSFPVYSLGGDWVDEYNRTNAEAAAAREYFLKVDDELRAVLMKGLILNVPFIDDRTRETLRVMNPMIDILETNKRELKRAYTDAFRRMLNDKYVR